MPRFFRRAGASNPSVDQYVAHGDSVPLRPRFPSGRTLAIGIGISRTALGATFLAAPVSALRILGVDTASAARVAWLSQMTAARDIVLGAGAAASAGRRGSSSWLLAGAVADAVDATALALALRQRRVAGVGAAAMIGAASGAAVLGSWAAIASRR